jgi:hypothetical protein
VIGPLGALAPYATAAGVALAFGWSEGAEALKEGLALKTLFPEQGAQGQPVAAYLALAGAASWLVAGLGGGAAADAIVDRFLLDYDDHTLGPVRRPGTDPRLPRATLPWMVGTGSRRAQVWRELLGALVEGIGDGRGALLAPWSSPSSRLPSA